MGCLYEGSFGGHSEKDFVKPFNVNLINVCLDSGMIAVEGCQERIRWLL
jgi:hypothetical protein